MEGIYKSVLGSHDNDITKRACKKIGRCRPRKTLPCHTLPNHGSGCDDAKNFAQQQKWQKTKLEQASNCHMTYKNVYSNIELDSTSKYSNKKNNPKAKEYKSTNNNL
jgi:hypothetical protein